ncbi:MAG: anthranilate phosphoribosyltransferase [Verrucomicrobiota bacterium]|nr:anthranilate phosphoribosyltransferase [Verrucomicrobiota bacterium]
MSFIEKVTNKLAAGENLSKDQAVEVACILASSSVDLGLKENFLIALSDKGETAVEVAAFASAFRDMAVDPNVLKWAPNAIDVCGTGGDESCTFNISTTVSFIVAAAGVPVFKHGNRSITSNCGSADLIEAIGIQLDAPEDMLHASLEELNFCFFFAPAFHPAFKEIVPVRRALAKSGRRTIFNLLGPLINPGRPAYQLMGVFGNQWVEPIADALDTIRLKAGLVAHCTTVEGQSLDELSCSGTNQIAGIGRLKTHRGVLPWSEVGLPKCGLNSLKGGDVDKNIKTLEAIFDGFSSGVSRGLLDSILLNAGAALWIAGQAEDIKSGIKRAREVIDSGRARQWLRSARAFYS